MGEEKQSPHQVILDKNKKKPLDTQPIQAQVAPFVYRELKEFLKSIESKKNALILLLDHLQDPQNFGAICRTAEALGVDAIVLPKDRSVMVTQGVYHASAGAVETIPIVRVTNLIDAVLKLKEAGFWVAGTSLGDKTLSLDQVPSIEKLGLILGTEGDGMGPALAKHCDYLVQIPLVGKIQSLNVSVATAILIYHFNNRSN